MGSNEYPEWVRKALPDGAPVPQRIPYRVFYAHGVYEWYVNTGRAPLWHYRTRGELVGAYNVRAGICAPFAQLKNILK